MENRQYYPLTSSQHLIFLSWQFTTHKQIMNIPTSFLTDAQLDLDLLKKALEEAIQRNDAFGIRITKQGKDRVQYFTDRKVRTLETLDFTGKTLDEMEAFFYKIGHKKMPMYDQPLAKMYIVKAPDGTCGLFTCISHLILDSWAISMFYKDVMSIYQAYQKHEPLPKPLKSCEALMQKDIAYKATDRYQKDREFWQQEMAGDGTLPIYTHINGSIMLEKYRKLIRKPDYRFGRTFFLRTAAKHEVLMVEKTDMDQIKAFCLQNSIPVQMMFIMGLRTYLTRVNNREKDISIYNIVARRGTLEEKTSGGTRVQAMPFRTIFNEDLSFLDALGKLLEKQNTIYRHADIDTMELFDLAYSLYGMKRGEDFCSLPMTFQPVPMDLGNDMKIRTKWYCSGTAAASLYLTIMDGDGTGALRFYYEYMIKIIKAETIRTCHSYILKVIKAGIENPDITIKDLLDLPLAE